MPVKKKDEGKIYATNFKGSLYFIKLLAIKGLKYQTCTFKFITLADIVPYQDKGKTSDFFSLATIQSQNIGVLGSADAIELRRLISYPSQVLPSTPAGKIDFNAPFNLKCAKGVFQTGKYLGTKFTIKEFKNTRETYIDRKIANLFEEYPYAGEILQGENSNHGINPEKPFIIFRDVSRVFDFSPQSFSVDNLLSNIFEIKSYSAKPYGVRDNFCEGQYTNAGGLTYNLIDIFSFLHKELKEYYSCAASITSIYQLFDSYHQKYDDNFFHQGFSQKELLAFMEDNFCYDVVTDKYFIWDTWYTIGNRTYFIDIKFFTFFYNAVKKQRFIPINTLNGLTIKAKWEDVDHFKRLGLDPDEISQLNEIARQSKDLDDFLKKINPYCASTSLLQLQTNTKLLEE